MVTVFVGSLAVVTAVGVVADKVYRTNWSRVMCKVRKYHKPGTYTHVCKCGYTRVK